MAGGTGKRGGSKGASGGANPKLAVIAKSLEGGPPLTARAVAELSGVELKTVHNWVAEGRIEHFRTPGRHLRFRPEHVIDFLRSCGYRPEAAAQPGQRAVVLAKGPVRTSVRRSMSNGEVIWAENAYATLLAAGTQRPDVVILERGLMQDVDLQSYVKTLSRALPESKILVVANGSKARVPRGVRVVRVGEDLARALGTK